MTAAPAQSARPAKLPREQDPRNPVARLTALLDEGTLELITPDDLSGMLAVRGSIHGAPVVAFCSDATVMGGAMGDEGCEVVVKAYHVARQENVPIIGRTARHSPTSSSSAPRAGSSSPARTWSAR